MFSLILTILSIVLAGLLAVATIFYGSFLITQRAAEAKADRLLAEGQQLTGAAVLADADGVAYSTIADLVLQTYLTTDFNGAWALVDATGPSARFEADGIATDVCVKVMDKVGGDSERVTCINGTMTYYK